ncbi:MAG: DNA gyrase/topoisomerase IV subunit A [Porphyromonas sp.]|uniref:DNA gyrase/topoisomerase IV subunit A n=1 Tax=Porphyromonas sp. TaxID=1924944 RepID=UPI001CB50164|nr:DNA gyrase/topoisomerase IV subunit A [Porphyromonas sp.]MBF1376238.1 DNA gyrase/topoisomerase IV subunit A [Porphyromonas sp.]
MNIEHDDEEEKIPEVTPETIIEDEEPPAYQPAEGLPYRPELSNLSKMYQTWFLDYASYVILERAVPHIDDGLKPVQRRILYNLKRMDSGKLIKVANIVGETMKYHPHGDASINDALVQLGQKGFLIDTQGNWGNILTGDPAAAGRYIEAKLSAFAHEAVYSDRVTPWKKTYDGTTDEPVALPVKFPLLLAQGAEGIAVGLSSKILSHNFVELAEAACAYLRGEEFTLYPDFPTGGLIDVSRYNDGERGGSLKSRAKIDKIDSKTLSISELPAGKTTTTLIESILKAVEKGKIRIRRVDDMTAATTDIRLTLAAGVSSDKAIDALYAFTDCEVSISPNCCVIYEEKPLFTTVSELLRYSVERTKFLFGEELKILLSEKEEQYLGASLERIFIEERIYKDKAFEEAADEATALAHIAKRIEPFADRFLRPVTTDDLRRLLELRMARILRFNLPKHEAALLQIEQDMAQLRHDIAHLTDYTIRWYQHLIQRYGAAFPRRTKITNFGTIEVTKVAELDAKLYINREEGFFGTALKDAEFVCNCSSLDEVIIIFRSGKYFVGKVEDKKFYGNEEVIYINRYQRNDERTIYNVIYRDGKGGSVYAKRFNVLSVIRDRVYDLTRGKEGSRVLYFSANGNGEAEKVAVKLKIRNARQRLFQFEKDFSDIPIKSRSSVGLLVTKAEVHSVSLLSKGFSTLGGRDVWFDRDVLRLNYNEQGQYLGSFHARDRILVVLKSGECYTSDFSDSIHIEENLLRIEKNEPRKIWTAVYYDADQKYHYIKRFSIEEDQKRENILGENPKNELLLLTDTYYPRLLIGRQEKGGELRTTEIDVEEFALVKSIRARGKRIAPYLIVQVEELPPLKESPVFESEHDESMAESEEEEADLFAGQTEDSSNE